MSASLLEEIGEPESPLHNILVRANKFSSLMSAYHVIDGHPLHVIERKRHRWELCFHAKDDCCDHSMRLYVNDDLSLKEIQDFTKHFVLVYVMSALIDPDGVMNIVDGVTRIDSPHGWLEVF